MPIDFGSILGDQGGFEQAAVGWQSPYNPEGVPTDIPWYQNRNLLASVLGQTGAALDPEGLMAPIGQLGAQFGQSNLMEMSRKTKSDEDSAFRGYLMKLLAGGTDGFTPANQAGPTKAVISDNQVKLDITPDGAATSAVPQSTGGAIPGSSQVPSLSLDSPVPTPGRGTKISDLRTMAPFL